MLTALLSASGAAAQQRPQSPHIGYLYPAGGRQGASLEITVGGQMLAGVNGAQINGSGVQITVGSYDRPLTQRQVLLLRDKLEEARKKWEAQGTDAGQPQPGAAARPGRGGLLAMSRLAKEAGITEEEIRKLIEFQRNRSDPKKQPNPQIEEKVTLQIKIAPDAPPGPRELRLLTLSGPTNPLRFEVGTIGEQPESEPNDSRTANEITIPLPVVLNGQILPGDVDRFTFSARKGARIVVATQARGLVPYLADAVPGWFQPIATLYDPRGREIACADHYRFQPDPVLTCEIPADGTYTLEIRDTLYRGREDFVYRITLGEIPYVTGIFPLGGRAGASATVEVKGWNLPQSRLAVSVQGENMMPVGIQTEKMSSNCLPFAVDTLPETLEKEPNSERKQAQRVSLPQIINGRLDRPGDADVYRIEGKAGESLVAEVYARRLNSPLDSRLELTDAQGRPLASNDDSEDRGAGLLTHQADSRLQVTLPASGTYYLTLRDTQRKGGEEYAYRLRIGAPQPDYQLRVTPSSLGLRAGATIPITVYALRRDGFSGEIALRLKDAPAGFVLSGGRIPAGQDQVRLTLTAPAVRLSEPVNLQMEGVAVIQGQEVRRAACPAEDMMQAFAYRHLVPAQEWIVTVSGRALLGISLRPRADSPVKIPAGGTARLQLYGPVGSQGGRLQVELSEPPPGIAIQNVTVNRGEIVVELRADAGKVKPGMQGNLIFEASREMPTPAANARPGAAPRRVPAGMLPAIPFEIVAPVSAGK
jgi:hypothetical protein